MPRAAAHRPPGRRPGAAATAAPAQPIPANIAGAVADTSRPPDRPGPRRGAQAGRDARLRRSQARPEDRRLSSPAPAISPACSPTRWVRPARSTRSFRRRSRRCRRSACRPNGSTPDPDHPNVIALTAPINAFAVPERVDIVWIRQNYHDLHDTFMGPADMPAFDAAVFKALKPGGEFIVLDHAAAGRLGPGRHRYDCTGSTRLW